MQASTIHRWLYEVAEHYNIPLVVLARQLRTTQQLAVEIARLLNTSARDEARHLVSERKRIPAQVDLYSRLVHAHAQPLLERQQAADRARSSAALGAEVRQQQKLEREKRRKEQHDNSVQTGAAQPD